MASQQSIEGKRAESIELMIVACISFLVIFTVMYYYYEYAWFYVIRYLFLGLSFIPPVVNDWLFFWTEDAGKFIVFISDDLTYYVNDFSKYYIDTDAGAKKKSQIDSLAAVMMGPYLVIPTIYMIIKEFRKPKGAIKKPSERSRESALYRYAKSQADIWPYIKPIVNIMGDMAEKQKSLDAEWYALSEIPYAWMQKRNILREIKTKKRRKLITVRERSEFTLDRDKAFKVLRENLGALWGGLDDLDFNHRCVLAVIVPHIFGKVSMSRLINRKIATYHESKKSKANKALEAGLRIKIEAEVDAILESHSSAFIMPYFEEAEFEDPFDPIASSFEELDSEKDMFDKGASLVKDTLLNHAYIKTVFFGLIERSWTYGVLASAELLWVKKVDRDLWYVISQQGRTSAFVEVCGAWSHYLAEDTYGFRTLMPQLDAGINAFDFDLWSTHANYAPLGSWDSTSKWDKLVPDGVGKGGNLPRPPGGKDSSQMV
jgi:hypothetical protein